MKKLKKFLTMKKKKFPIKLYNKLEDYNFDYSKHITNALTKNNRELSQAAKLIERKIKQNKTIYVCGNGGSSAIANHFVCDYFKGLSTNTNLVPKILSLNAHSELISAISNDLNYDQIFSYQANKLVKKDDLVIIFSSSGKSKNVKKLFQFTKKRRVKTIGFSGFNGGFLKKFSDISIHVDVDNYGITEDLFHIYMHIIMQFVRQKNLSKKKLETIKF